MSGVCNFSVLVGSPLIDFLPPSQWSHQTTLLDVIAMRKTSGDIEGEIRLNGFLQERTSFLRCSGYVEQFDVQQPELTVRETVEFCARLRLDEKEPKIGNDEGKLKFAAYVLGIMELTDIQNLQVGSFEEGGLTFEQRKRLSIACELAGCPSVVFLDEPTSGKFWLFPVGKSVNSGFSHNIVTSLFFRTR